MNLLTAFINNVTMHLPRSVEFVIKDKVEIDEINGKKKLVATKTKTSHFGKWYVLVQKDYPLTI